MLKSYMKRLEEAGHNPNDIQPSDDHTHMYDEQVEQSIVIRMKDHTEYLGMFEYKKDNEQKIFKALVYGKFFKEFSVAHFCDFLFFRLETQTCPANVARIASLHPFHDGPIHRSH